MEDLKGSHAAKESAQSVVGVGMDSCVMKTRHKGIFLVETTDFFYPLVDEPYVQGMIACANVLSDLYAMGVVHCDNMLMLLSLSLDMSPAQRKAVTPLLIKGFNDLANKAGTTVNGGQTVMNPWVIIGGVATAVAAEADFILPEKAVPGDVLVLTKPLGTQVAVNAHQWMSPGHEARLERVKDVITREEIVRAYRMAMHSMARLNQNGAILMHKYDAHGATDVTGFGILGHSKNLVQNQKAAVDFVIHTLPVLPKMDAVNAVVNFKLTQGFSAETSGGLLLAIPRENAEAFCRELQELDGTPAWIIGDVIEGTRTSYLTPDVKIIQVDTPEL